MNAFNYNYRVAGEPRLAKLPKVIVWNIFLLKLKKKVETDFFELYIIL